MADERAERHLNFTDVCEGGAGRRREEWRLNLVKKGCEVKTYEGSRWAEKAASVKSGC